VEVDSRNERGNGSLKRRKIESKEFRLMQKMKKKEENAGRS
jgi:hypothetical protein